MSSHHGKYGKFLVGPDLQKGGSLLKCCQCQPVAVVARLGDVWPVSDQIREMDQHLWEHEVSARRGIPMTEFGR